MNIVDIQQIELCRILNLCILSTPFISMAPSLSLAAFSPEKFIVVIILIEKWIDVQFKEIEYALKENTEKRARARVSV